MNEVILLFAGDFIPPETSDCIYSEELLQVLKDKDFSIVNLETPITTSNTKIEKTGNNFKRHPDTIKHINDGCFDAVALSNNHIRDYGDTGVLDTIEICKQNKINTVGAGKNIQDAQKPLRIQIKGIKISILNYSEREFNIADEKKAGANPYDTISSFYDIQKEKLENDHVIVVYHGGIEYQYYPTPEMVRKFKYMVDIGADAIVSHHTHRYSGSIIYKDKPIMFGLGNFISHTRSKVTKDWQVGVIARLSFFNKKIKSEFVPTIMNVSFNQIHLFECFYSILNEIESISENIENKEFFEKYWAKQDSLAKNGLYLFLKSNSRFNYRLKKYFPFVISNKLNSFKRKNLLNLVQCDSHRERLIRILK
ncbi:MAG: CapA family protein [Bacteroidetes bacterium]|nr:CapA family protein [Bacteroidota bacterium]